jgi:hypothetical protein
LLEVLFFDFLEDVAGDHGGSGIKTSRPTGLLEMLSYTCVIHR